MVVVPFCVFGAPAPCEPALQTLRSGSECRPQSDVDGCDESCDEPMTIHSGRSVATPGRVTAASSGRVTAAQASSAGDALGDQRFVARQQ